MNYSLLVSSSQPFGQLRTETSYFFFRQWPRCELLVECGSGNVLHHQEVHSPLRVKVVDGGDVGMVESGQG